jgi:hypothetical protein
VGHSSNKHGAKSSSKRRSACQPDENVHARLFGDSGPSEVRPCWKICTSEAQCAGHVLMQISWRWLLDTQQSVIL